MFQVLQNLRSGHIDIADVPPPAIRPGHLLSRTRCSLISSGTERTLVTFAQSGLIDKARQQPDKVKQVIDKLRTDGLSSTLHSVMARLDEPLPLGYCNCGTVINVGEGVEGFDSGDRIISNGPHAEIVCVPSHLCARVPESVTDEQAVFTVLASIGLQGIRLINPTFGEKIAVIGLGLIGLLSVQLLVANGCDVIAIDIDRNKLVLAENFGAHSIDSSNSENPIDAVLSQTNGRGVDGALITAAAQNDSIIHQAATMCRKRGRIVLVGVVDLNLNRSDFYEKEVSFQVSCSYGPGRYDDSYELQGHDYPPGFVRWTEQRNFQAILQSMARGQLQITNLISERIPQAKADRAYHILMNNPQKLALILTYPNGGNSGKHTIQYSTSEIKDRHESQAVIGLIGAGQFAKIMLLPALKSLNIQGKSIADINGVAGHHAAKKFGFENATNDYHELLNDNDINTVFISTRHDSHSRLVVDALRAGKHVAVEKPLCLSIDELTKIKEVFHNTSNQILHVGFNRRFSPFSEKIYNLTNTRREPLCIVFVINAGHIPGTSWVQHKDISGGRIIGEGVHWIDLMRFWVGHPISSVCATMIGDTNTDCIRDDKMTVTLSFGDGSIGTLHYFANGNKSVPKENCKLYCDGKILELDNFRTLVGYGWRQFKKMHSFRQNKGIREQYRRFIDLVQHGGPPLISFEDIENVTLASFAAVQSAKGEGLVHL